MGKVTAKIHARADVNTENELFNHESEEEILNAIGQDFETFCNQIIFVSMAYKEQVNQDYDLFARGFLRNGTIK